MGILSSIKNHVLLGIIDGQRTGVGRYQVNIKLSLHHLYLNPQRKENIEMKMIRFL